MKSTLTAFLTAVIICAMYLNSPYRENSGIVSVDVTSVEISDVNNNITLSGKARSKSTSLVFPKTSSTVEQILVVPGQSVCANEAIVVYSDGSQAVAKIDGTILEIYCSVGEISAPIIPCALIADLNNMEICAEVEQGSLQKIAIGNEAEIIFDANPENKILGEIENIAPFAKTSLFSLQKQEVKTDVVVAIKSKNVSIGPGYSASIKVKTQLKKNARLVPFDCIGQDDENREYIMLVGNDGLAEKLFVTTGLELETQAEILSEIHHDALIIRNPDEIAAGKKIKITVAP